MKKVLLLGVLLLPAVPGIIAGIQTSDTIHEDRRAAMLEERFIKFCKDNGRDYYSMNRAERDSYYLDFWTELDDYQAAADSVDSVLNAERRADILK